MISTPENAVIKGILEELFPGTTLYENDVPKEFKRPSFVFIEPEDKTDTKELSKLLVQVTKSVTLYAYYKEDEPEQAVATQHKLLERLLKDKKHLIPESDRRYLTLEDCTSSTDTVNCLLEFILRFSQTVLRTELAALASQKIRHIVINPSQGGE